MLRRSLLALAMTMTMAMPATAAETIRGPARVLDGDTLMVDGTRIRLGGVDAPEMSDPRGPVARGALDDLIGGRLVACTPTDATTHGRIVARCTAAGRDLGDAMIRDGWAFAYRTFTADYDEAEAEARRRGVGFWQQADEASVWEIVGAIGQFVAGIGVPFAVVLAAYCHRRQRKWEMAVERCAIASALRAEINQLSRHLTTSPEELRDEKEFIRRVAARETPRVLFSNHPLSRHPVHDGLVDRIGMLPPETAGAVAFFYSRLCLFNTQATLISQYNWAPEDAAQHAAAYEELGQIRAVMLENAKAAARLLDEVIACGPTVSAPNSPTTPRPC